MDQLSHRKADARLRLLEADGTPLSGENVRIDQTGHSFLFGCGAFDAVALMKTEDGSQRAFLQERMEKWLRLFNYGTLPFYWGRYEPEEGKTAYTVTVMKRQTEIFGKRAQHLRDIRRIMRKGFPIDLVDQVIQEVRIDLSL